MKDLLMAGVAALAVLMGACAHNPAAGEPEPYATVVGVSGTSAVDSVTEAEVRAFLAAEVEARREEARADSMVANAEVEVETPKSSIAQEDFDLPITLNERVEFWMDYFQNRGRERFATYLSRMGRFEDLIRSELRAREMPEDLIYLALIESGFSTSATSVASAVGVWQFMAPTARQYRLEVSRYIDERRDPVRSTMAALTYLENLHRQFGSWYLAAAGYNSGENRVERILRAEVDGARGDEDIFWEISDRLPRETRNYVPKLIAATILAKYRDRYGFDDVVPESGLEYDLVTVPDATELGVIARAAGVTAREIELLNPQFLRGMTPPGREVEVRVPSGRSDEFRVAYARIPPHQRVTKVEHLVRRGETLSGIAQRYGTTVAAIKESNGISNVHSIRVGRTLVVAYGERAPSTGRGARVARAESTAPATTAATNKASSAARGAMTGQTTYQVRAGDSLWKIANRHGVTIGELREWNRIEGNRIRPGQQLRVRRDDEVIRYRIQPGDTIWRIAREHGISADRLMQWNSINAGALIRPGEELEVPVTQ